MARSDMVAEDFLARQLVELMRWAQKHLYMLNDNQLAEVGLEATALNDVVSRALGARGKGRRIPEDQIVSSDYEEEGEGE